MNSLIITPVTTPTLPTNPIQEATLQFLKEQGWRGFQPEWMISFHYANGLERGWNTARRAHNTGNARSGSAPLLLNQPTSSGITRARNDFFKVSKDAQHIRNLIRKGIWNVNRFDRVDESTTPMIFFHEKGGQNVQYHTHLLLGKTPDNFKTIESIEQFWQDYVMPRAKCISRTNSTHVRVADSHLRAIGYLTKELSFRRDVVDYEASCLFHQLSKMELLLAELEL
jgi:hypothetical protein